MKFPEKAPGYVAPVKPREPTPGLQKKKRGRRSKSQGSDRGLPLMLARMNLNPPILGTGEGIAAAESR